MLLTQGQNPQTPVLGSPFTEKGHEVAWDNLSRSAYTATSNQPVSSC